MKTGVSLTFSARVIKSGVAEGEALVSSDPIGFLGGVDGTTGIVTERGHPLEGQCVAGKVLVFPTGKGSTVGSYVLYQLAAESVAPSAIINAESEPIVAVGAIISEIPMVDHVSVLAIETGDWVRVEGDCVTVWKGITSDE
jgi:uncharacterized protein